jgi:hypothetical protein
MFYVRRATDGLIEAVFAEPQDGSEGPLPGDHPDVLEFLLRHGGEEAAAEALSVTDADLARVVEDLIALLADNGVIMFTDLPEGARRKLLLRGRLRARLGAFNPLVDGDDDVL